MPIGRRGRGAAVRGDRSPARRRQRGLFALPSGAPPPPVPGGTPRCPRPASTRAGRPAAAAGAAAAPFDGPGAAGAAVPGADAGGGDGAAFAGETAVGSFSRGGGTIGSESPATATSTWLVTQTGVWLLDSE